MSIVTPRLIQFVQETGFDSLPPEMVRVTKRGLVDAIACALAGTRTDRGKIAVRMARRLGGQPEATVIGAGDRVSCVNAAFANGELVNALDFDATPHLPPNVIPPLVAIAQAKRSTGRELIACITVAHELAWRLYTAMSAYTSTYIEKATSPDVFGNGNEGVLGAALGAGRLLGLDAGRLANALGLAAYFCSLPTGKDWHDARPPKPMIKYAPSGWLCQAAVTAALLAEEGCTGNTSVLDAPHGFWKFYGAAHWNSESVLHELGRAWLSADFQFKPYACCRFFHAQLDCFLDILRSHELEPAEIDSVEALGMPFAANPDPMSVVSQSDAQFSLPFNLAAAAYRVPFGPAWQDLSVRADPRLHAFMKKVTVGIDPKAQSAKREDRRAWAARVTVVAKGRTHVRETRYARGTPVAGFDMSDEELSEKFRNGAAPFLTDSRLQSALEQLWHLDEQGDVGRLMESLTF